MLLLAMLHRSVRVEPKLHKSISQTAQLPQSSSALEAVDHSDYVQRKAL